MIKIFHNSKINFVSKFNKAYFISLSLIIIGFSFYLFKGAEFGIDFNGGTELIIEFEQSKLETNNQKSELINLFKFNDISFSKIKTYGKNKIQILSEENLDKDFISNQISNLNFNIVSYNKIGSTISKELKNDAVKALLIAIILIGLYIIVRFDWYSAVGSIAALVHDLMIVISILIVSSVQFDTNIIAALLIIIGYSLNDTIVIFDRIRENINEFSNVDLDQTINLSLNQTLGRTMITSLTTLFVVVSLFVFGGGSLSGLSYALIIGVLSGTYSSLFVATPIMMFLRNKYYIDENEKEEKWQ
jgi:preprotein translocase subunit SecF